MSIMLSFKNFRKRRLISSSDEALSYLLLLAVSSSVLITRLVWQSDRLHKVLEFVSTVHDLCAVLGMDFFSTVTEVHPSLNDATGVQSKSISNDTLSRLAKTVLALKEDKKQRLSKVVRFIVLLFGVLIKKV